MNVPDKNSAPRRQQQAFLLRLPQSLKEHLKQQAKSQQPFAKQRDSRPAGGRTGWLHITK